MGSLDGKVALVTGAAAGIGRATALAFARAGANVVVSDVADAGGAETVNLIELAGGTALYVHANVADDASVQALVATTRERFGRLDFACNNAGIEGTPALTADYPPEAWQRVIDINLTGVWRSMRHQIPAMLESGGGAIVNMASILGTVAFPQAAAYVAAKHGVIGLTKTAALEYSAQGVRVNAVCPGFIMTPMLERGGMHEGSEAHTMLVGRHPIGRLGTSEEIAAAVVWLCSPEASFVTGHALLADGGYIAQ